MHNIGSLNALSLEELQKIAQQLSIVLSQEMSSQELIYKILDAQAEKAANAKESSFSKVNKNRSTSSLRRKLVKPVREEEKQDKVILDQRDIEKSRERLPEKEFDAKEKKTTIATKKTMASKALPQEKQRKGKGSKHPQIKQKERKTSALSKLEGLIEGEGVLELALSGYGFLRSSNYNYLPSADDIYVGHEHIKKWGLKRGDTVRCTLRPPKVGDKYFGLHQILSINGQKPEKVLDRVAFEHLTPIFPNEKFNITTAPNNYMTRIVDLLSPIGKGQRGMIVAQPKVGKTFLIKNIANGIAQNHPDAYLIILLIDERPEEVHDMMCSVKAEVIASTFDKHAENHVKVAKLVLEKAKRMVEAGHDVVIILDGITRLVRAHNMVTKSSGKILSGGIDANAILPAKHFFGAARNLETKGSLTILATALINTSSKMDEVIFEEFKGTGNMELQLDRNLANRQIYPAIDIANSSTRRNDLLQNAKTCGQIKLLRHAISDMKPHEALEFLLNNMRGTQNNAEFLASMHD